MEKQPAIIPEELELFLIEVKESKIVASKEKEKLNFNLNVGHSLMHNLPEERLKLDLVVDLQAEAPLSKIKSLAQFKFAFHFKITNLQNFYELNAEQNPVFYGLLIATLLGICFSTARGIIYEKLSNTNMQGIILPVVSPQKMLQQNNK
jgi:hypothetical protein